MKRTMLIIALASCILSACSLEENPQGYVTRDSFYKTETQCWSALRAVYTPLHHMYTKEFMIAVEAATDLWNLNSSSYYDATLSITPTTCGVASDIWKFAYKGIARANECVECIAESPIKNSVKAPMVAEARAMRALYYYILTSFMGDVPFYTESVADLDVIEHIRKLQRTPASQIRDSLYNDLKSNAMPFFTKENGYRCRANQVANQHAGFALTAMLMAKLAMWEKDWNAAIEAVELLESVYGDEFSEDTFPLEDIKWSRKMTDESIFEIQHEWKANGAKFYGEIAAVMTPKCSGSGVYDGVYMPELALTGTTSTPIRANSHFASFVASVNDASADPDCIYPAVDADMINSGAIKDRRFLLTFGAGNLATKKIFNSVRSSGVFYGGPKFWCYGMTGNYDSNNYKLFRYADALLMKAECLYEIGQEAEAVSYINKVRRRAYTDPETGVTDPEYEYVPDNDFEKMLRDERARELGGEFHRKFDLVRWGVWVELTKTYNESPKGLPENIRQCHEYYPIPETECAKSYGKLTNDAYNI